VNDDVTIGYDPVALNAVFDLVGRVLVGGTTGAELVSEGLTELTRPSRWREPHEVVQNRLVSLLFHSAWALSIAASMIASEHDGTTTKDALEQIARLMNPRPA
jgi:hypothetical protein